MVLAHIRSMTTKLGLRLVRGDRRHLQLGVTRLDGFLHGDGQVNEANLSS